MPITEALKLMEEIRQLVEHSRWHLGRRVVVEVEELYELLYRLESHLPHTGKLLGLMEQMWEHVQERSPHLGSRVFANAELMYDWLNRIEAELPRSLEGREREEGQSAIVKMLTTRFGQLPLEIETDIRHITEPHELERLAEEAEHCPSLEAFDRILNPIAAGAPASPAEQQAARRAKQEAILQTLTIRFASPPEDIESAIRRTESLDALTHLLTEALHCESVEEFRAAMQAYAEQPDP